MKEIVIDTGTPRNVLGHVISGAVASAVVSGAINYKKAHNFAAAYNRFGNVIWTVFVEAEFGYDGEKVWVNGNPYGFYEKMGIIRHI